MVPAGLQRVGDGVQNVQLDLGAAAQGVLQLRLHPALQQPLLQLRFLPEAAQVILGKGGGHLGPLGQAAQLLVLLRQLGQHLLEVQGGLDGLDHIHREHGGQHQSQGVHQPGGHIRQQAANGGMDEPHQQDGKKAPGDGAGQADVTVQVEFLLGVVPVADLEQRLHGGAGDVFQRRGGQHAQQPHQPQIPRHRQGNEQDDDGPGAVDGQQRPPEEAPVHPMPLAEGDVAALPDPAAEAIEEKQQDPLARGIDVHK